MERYLLPLGAALAVGLGAWYFLRDKNAGAATVAGPRGMLGDSWTLAPSLFKPAPYRHIVAAGLQRTYFPSRGWR